MVKKRHYLYYRQHPEEIYITVSLIFDGSGDVIMILTPDLFRYQMLLYNLIKKKGDKSV